MLRLLLVINWVDRRKKNSKTTSNELNEITERTGHFG